MNIETSAEIHEIAAALAKAQGKFGTIEKTETAKIKGGNSEYSYRYANLAGVLAAVRTPLSENGIAIFQPPHIAEGNRIAVTLILMHSSGQFLRTTFSMFCPTNATPQQQGGIVSFIRRYQLLSCLGLATDDDDAEEASEQQVKQQSKQPERQPKAERTPKAESDNNGPAAEGQIKAIKDICDKAGWDAEQTAKDWYKEALINLTSGQAKDCILRLQALVREELAQRKASATAGAAQ